MPLIAAGSELLNVGSQIFSNSSSQNFAKQQYAQQRQDALADWNMNNLYNSPAEQMKRYKAAGLNPNLIYNQSNTAQPVRSSSPQAWHPQAPQINGANINSSILGMYDIAKKQAETNNVQATTDLIKQQLVANVSGATSANLRATAARTDVGTESDSLKLAQARALNPYTLESARLDTMQKAANVEYTLDNNQRAAAMNAVSIQQALQNIANLKTTNEKTRQEIENLQRTGDLQELDLNLKRMGIQPHDPAWSRALGQLVNAPDIKKAINEMIKPMTAVPGSWNTDSLQYDPKTKTWNKY